MAMEIHYFMPLKWYVASEVHVIDFYTLCLYSTTHTINNFLIISYKGEKVGVACKSII